VAGCIAAYLTFHFRANLRFLVLVAVLPMLVDLPALAVAIAFAAMQAPPVQNLLAFGPAQPLAFAAPVAGAIAGVLLTPLLWMRRPARRQRRR
jgi:membrane associated rhomboid family serine protease